MQSSRPCETFSTSFALLHPSLQTTLRLGNPFSQFGREFLFSGCTNHPVIPSSPPRLAFDSIRARSTNSILIPFPYVCNICIRNCHDFLVYLAPFCLDSAKKSLLHFRLLLVSCGVISHFRIWRATAQLISKVDLQALNDRRGQHLSFGLFHYIMSVWSVRFGKRIEFVSSLSGSTTLPRRSSTPLCGTPLYQLWSRELRPGETIVSARAEGDVLYDKICISGANRQGRERRSRAFMGWYQNCLRQGKSLHEIPLDCTLNVQLDASE